MAPGLVGRTGASLPRMWTAERWKTMGRTRRRRTRRRRTGGRRGRRAGRHQTLDKNEPPDARFNFFQWKRTREIESVERVVEGAFVYFDDNIQRTKKRRRCCRVLKHGCGSYRANKRQAVCRPHTSLSRPLTDIHQSLILIGVLTNITPQHECRRSPGLRPDDGSHRP